MPRAVVLLLLPLAGCDVAVPGQPPEPASDPIRAESRFDPTRAGTIQGTVVWKAPPPLVKPFRSVPHPLSESGPANRPRDWPAPNAPWPGAAARAAREVVVFLRGIDPGASKPWAHEAVRVKASAQALRIFQGRRQGRTGFVRTGDRIELATAADQLHLVQGRGAAFFSLPLPPDAGLSPRRLEKPGLVELRSGSGLHWLRAYLFVDDHPYYTHTDDQGRFLLASVPPGRYEVVAWHPNWRVRSQVRHTEHLHITQVHYHPPLEATRVVALRPGQRAAVDLELAP